jgi:hypothetical protein
MTRQVLARSVVMAAAFAVCAAGSRVRAEDTSAKIELYGFAMLDMGYDFNANDPDWFDVMRPTKLPAFDKEFGEDGRFYSGVRQSRLGVKSWIPTTHGEIYAIFEFELFGTGVTLGRRRFACAKRTVNGRVSAPGRPGARSWIPTSSRTRSSTGDRTAWSSSATFKFATCR